MASATGRKVKRTKTLASLADGGHVWIVTAKRPLGGGDDYYTTISLQALTPSGGVSKAKYHAPAKLTRPLKRYDCGSTIGHGFWTRHRGTDPEGAECFVYGWAQPDPHDGVGGVSVALPGGGYGSTIYPSKPDEDVPAVEILDPAVRDALDAAIGAALAG